MSGYGPAHSSPCLYCLWCIWSTPCAYFGIIHPFEFVLGHPLPSPQNGPFSHVLGCITPFTTFQCEEHIPSAPKSGPGIHPMHIKLILYHLIGTLYMLGWVRMPENGLVQVASTTGCVLCVILHCEIPVGLGD